MNSIALRNVSAVAVVLAGAAIVQAGATPGPALSLEAERATLSAEQASIVPDRQNASSKACIRLRTPDGRRQDEPSIEAEPALRATLDVPWRGPVQIWARVLATSSSRDSLWISVDGSKPRAASLSRAPDWRWQQLFAARLRRPGPIDLRITTREPGVCIDRITVLGSARLTPKGLSDVVTAVIKSPYPKPPVKPPAEHPRVFLRREHVVMIKKRLAHSLMSETRKRFYATADCQGDGRLPPSKDATRGNYRQGLMETIDCNALLYVLNGDRVRGQRAVDMFMNVMSTLTFPERRDVTRAYGRTILCGSLVYDWCYDLLRDARRGEILDFLVQLASMTEIGYPPARQGAVTGHGGEAQLMRDQLAAAIAVYDEYPDWYQFAAGRFFAEFVPARNFFFKARRHHQGDSYGWYRFRWSMFATFLFDRLGAGSVFNSEQAQVPYSWIYMRRGDGSLLRDGDTFCQGAYWMFPWTAMMTASYYRDPFINDEFRRQLRRRPASVPVQWMVLFYDPAVPTRPIRDLPLTRYFPSPAGDMIARTGWRQGLASPVAMVEMKGASYHFNNHDHLDAGAFQVYYRGALATDAGCYGPYGTPYDRCWNKRSISHNILLIYDPAAEQNALRHDGGQNFPNHGREPRNLETLLARGYGDGAVLAHAVGPDPQTPYYSYLKADLTPGYTDRARSVVRSFAFLNRRGEPSPAALVVFDRITANQPRCRKVWLLHCVQQPTIDAGRIDVRRTTDGCNGRLLVDVLLPDASDRRFETIGGPGREAEVFGHNFVPGHPTTESQGWRVELSPVADSRTAAFLTAMQVMDARGGPQPQSVTRIDAERAVGSRLGDAAVVFSRDAEPLAAPLTLDAGKGDELSWVIVDLAPGTWAVRDAAGRELGRQAVASGSGVLCGRAPGRIHLERLPGSQAPRPALPLPQVSQANDAGTLIAVDGRLLRAGAHRDEENTLYVAVAPIARALGYDVTAQADRLALARATDRCELRSGAREYAANRVAWPTTHELRVHGGEVAAAVDDLPNILRALVAYDDIGDTAAVTPLPRGQHWIAAADCSDETARDKVRDSFDGDLRSYWAAQGDGQWICYDLGAERRVGRVRIAWLHAEKRKERFELQLSVDNAAWTTVFEGESSGREAGFEAVDFAPANARYVRVVGHGNTLNAWNSIREIRILAPAA